MAETGQQKCKRWQGELEIARKTKGLKEWLGSSKRIIRRYRDERDAAGSGDGFEEEARFTGSRFNILWSNVQTLQPALYAKPPKPVVERRYLDRDDVGRTASVILERTLTYELDDGLFDASMQRAVLDRLLPGRAILWARYEPRFEAVEDVGSGGGSDDRVDYAGPSSGVADRGRGGGNLDAVGSQPTVASDGLAAAERVASESVPVDYIDYRDFLHSIARTWPEVWWIAKRVYMTASQIRKRGWPADKIPFNFKPAEDEGSDANSPATLDDQRQNKRAIVWEIWNSKDRTVVWIADGYNDDILEERPDPLKLEGFWPIAEPLYATLTNDSLIPRPDFKEYEDQALELDDLTQRISKLTQAIKVAGVYDGSQKDIGRMFQEGFENQLVAIDNMTEFTQKAGGKEGLGVLWLLPIADMAQTLIHLQNAREIVKQSLYEITGISDIVRGQAGGGGSKTATEQRIKGEFASLRLNCLQKNVARFARDTLRIMAEIIAEHFDPQTLRMVSGYDEWAREQWPPESFQAAPPPQMGHNGGSPMDMAEPASRAAGTGAPGGGLPSPAAGLLPPMMMPPPPTPEQQAQAKADEMFSRAVALLKNEKLRGFRIDVETDSMIEPDKQAVQQSRTEFMGAVSQFLPKAMEAVITNPSMGPLMARLMMFMVRGFSAGRDLESAFEQFIADQEKAARNPKPKPPSPDEIKVQAEMQKQQMESQRQQQQMAGEAAKMQAEAQNEAARMQMELQIEQQKAALEMQMMQAKMEFEQQKLQMQERKLLLDAQAAQQKHAMDAAAMETKAAFDMDAASRDREASVADQAMAMEASEHKHELGMEVMEAKAKQAKVPKPNGGK